MTHLPLIIEAPIEPEACARPRAAARGNGRVRVYTPSATLTWQARLLLYAQRALRLADDGGLQLIEGPLRVDILAVLRRPSRLNTRSQYPGAQWAPVRPDLDNVAKNVLDALRSIWRDDAQVVLSTLAKVYAAEGAAPRTIVRIDRCVTMPHVALRLETRAQHELLWTAGMESDEASAESNRRLTSSRKRKDRMRGAAPMKRRPERGENDDE